VEVKVSDLREVIDKLSKRELSRKQFIAMVGGSFLGMLGVFRIMQALNTPAEANLAKSHREVFGEREYGHPSDDEIHQAKKLQAKTFDEDVFG
jgi:hypothetical protein